MQIVVEVAEVWSEQATGTEREYETAIEAHLAAQGEWSTLKSHFGRYLAVLPLYFVCPATFTFAFTAGSMFVWFRPDHQNLDLLRQEKRLERIP